MSTSTARRIRRIGLLPTLPLQEVMDDNQRTALVNLHAKVDNAKERLESAKQQVAFTKKNPKSSDVEKTAAKNLLTEAESDLYSANKNLQDRLRELERLLNHKRVQRTPLTPEQVAEESKSIRDAAKLKRVNAKRLNSSKSPVTQLKKVA